MQICYIKPKKDNLDNSKIKYWLKYKSRKYLNLCVCNAIVCMYTTTLFANTRVDKKMAELESRVNSTGDLVVHVLQLATYWTTMTFALFEIIKTAKRQDLPGVASIVLKYGAIMVAAYGMPSIWQFIKEMFID